MSEFTTIKVHGAEALQVLNDHRLRFESTGLYPFLIGEAVELERLREAAEFDDRSVVEILQASREVDLSAWLAGRRRAAEKYEWSPIELEGEWPSEILAKGEISLHRDVLSGKIHNDVYVGLAAIRNAWELPAQVRYGGWNDCPPAEVHCAFHHEWQKRYGTEIVGLSGDVIECHVDRPPRNRELATALAWEQYWYCADIVEQGCETVANLAATLLDSRYWYFWWD